MPQFYSLPLICAESAEIQSIAAFFLLRLRICRTFTRCQAFAPQNGGFAQQSFNCGTFVCHPGFEHTTLSPVVELLHHKMALNEDSALSLIMARLRKKMPHFRDDSTYARKTAHFLDCGVAIKVRRTQLGSSEAHHTTFSKYGCGTFVAFFLTCTVHGAAEQKWNG